ncbi:MAG: bifunctional precorrin-2 dehydrogenase/sirohydrochlorin ferrochelatase [Peptococcaceae bacterium]|nr:bifunctional precorrin-2 dehydrogenase/sirohydrochlorin ferrochelatase [Peptococcaceae bacterium]
MARSYPVSLNIENRLCLVVGGGQVAERKVGSLLECGANVRLVSPSVTEGLRRLASEGRVEHIADCYRKEYLEGVVLVVGATDDDGVNARVSADSMERGLLVNVVDDPPRGNFYVPAVVRRGPLQIAVSTGGKSPLLARKIKEQLEEMFPEEYGGVAHLVGELREKVIREVEDPLEKERLLSSMLDDCTMDLLKTGRFDLAKERIRNAYLGGGSKPQDRSR